STRPCAGISTSSGWVVGRAPSYSTFVDAPEAATSTRSTTDAPHLGHPETRRQGFGTTQPRDLRRAGGRPRRLAERGRRRLAPGDPPRGPEAPRGRVAQ